MSMKIHYFWVVIARHGPGTWLTAAGTKTPKAAAATQLERKQLLSSCGIASRCGARSVLHPDFHAPPLGTPLLDKEAREESIQTKPRHSTKSLYSSN